MMKPFYALAICERGKEIELKIALKAANLFCYVPLFLKCFKPRKKKKPVCERFPLFPGYAFVLTDGSDKELSTIVNAKGIVDLFSIDEVIVPIKPDSILKFMKRERSGEFDGMRPNENDLWVEQGMTVRINDGAFSGFSGVVQSIGNRKGVKNALISVINRKIQIPLEFLERI